MAAKPSMSGLCSLALCNNKRHGASFHEVMLAFCIKSILSKFYAFVMPLQIC
jgi:hypothetical protein